MAAKTWRLTITAIIADSEYDPANGGMDLAVGDLYPVIVDVESEQLKSESEIKAEWQQETYE
jgi:hypothetical protein|tara:strand:- start:25679 stop:25864 length:186 start_codon:yes stop_codon:yes gene_type:complete